MEIVVRLEIRVERQRQLHERFWRFRRWFIRWSLQDRWHSMTPVTFNNNAEPFKEERPNAIHDTQKSTMAWPRCSSPMAHGPSSSYLT